MSRTNERGQAVVLMVISLAVLTGMAALVLDVGIWMRTDRRLQATADAAALAGAQKLPTDVAGAKALAQTYANQNGGDVLGSDITVTSTYTSNDTISVRAAKTQSGIFSKILGINSANIKADAKARVDSPQQAQLRRPDGRLLRSLADPELQRQPHADLRRPDDDGLRQDGRAGSLRHAQPRRRKRNAGRLGGRKLDPPRVRQVPAARHVPLRSGREVQLARTSAAPSMRASARVLLFPVFKTLSGNRPERAVRHHRLDRVLPDEGNRRTATAQHSNGYFTEYIAQGILAQSGSGAPNTFGVRSVQLVG